MAIQRSVTLRIFIFAPYSDSVAGRLWACGLFQAFGSLTVSSDLERFGEVKCGVFPGSNF